LISYKNNSNSSVKPGGNTNSCSRFTSEHNIGEPSHIISDGIGLQFVGGWLANAAVCVPRSLGYSSGI
jgi:hypothetical protein